MNENSLAAVDKICPNEEDEVIFKMNTMLQKNEILKNNSVVYHIYRSVNNSMKKWKCLYMNVDYDRPNKF